MNDATPLVEVDELVKHFGSVIALNGVSLNVRPHQVIGDGGADDAPANNQNRFHLLFPRPRRARIF